MSVSTKSELLFQELCTKKAIKCYRIPEGLARQADFRIILGGQQIIVEVKQIEPNDADRDILNRQEAGHTAPHEAPVPRVRDLINKAYGQLKSSCADRNPGIVVIYNHAYHWNYIDRWTVTTAMFGNYGISLSPNPRSGWDVVFRGFRDNRRTGASFNRALSALGVLTGDSASDVRLDCYHNPFAAIPLDGNSMKNLVENQYVHPNPHSGQYTSWDPVELDSC